MTENAKQEFKQWIKERNLAEIRSDIESIHSLDPNGEAGEVDERLLLVTQGGISDEELYEEYQELNHPMTDDKTQWNKDYFNMHKVKLQRNFSKERLEHVRELGKFIYPPKPKVPTPQSSTNETQVSQKKSSLNKTIIVVGAIVIGLAVAIAMTK